jgi:hypothetical protein
MKPITSLHYAKHCRQAISKASKWGHLGICDVSPERCWIHESSKRLVMLSIEPKTNSTVALDPPPTYCFRFMLPLPTLQHFLQQGFLFHLNSSLAEHQSEPRPKTIQASHSHPDSLPNRAWWGGGIQLLSHFMLDPVAKSSVLAHALVSRS